MAILHSFFKSASSYRMDMASWDLGGEGGGERAGLRQDCKVAYK